MWSAPRKNIPTTRSACTTFAPETFRERKSRSSINGASARAGSAPVGRRQPSSCHHPVLEVRDAGRLDRPDLLKLDLGAPEVVEEASAVPEQHRNDVELELVQEPRRQVLLNDLGAAPEPDVLTVRGLLRPRQCPLDPVGDEVERRAPLHLDRLARVMGEDEHVVVVRRVVSPPTLPRLIPPVPAAHGPEHIAAHHTGADVRARFFDYPCALVDLAALHVMRLAPSGQRNYPVVEPLPTLAERVLLALVRAGDESVCRDRDVTPELLHSDL